jgi:hypothetical protein
MRIQVSNNPNNYFANIAPFIAAVIGASSGVLIAVAIACWLYPISATWAPFNDELLRSTWSQLRPEPRESKMLALAAILGVVGAMLGAQRKLPPIHLGWAIAIGILTSLLLNFVMRYALTTPDAAAPVTALATLWGAVVFGVLTGRGGIQYRQPIIAPPNITNAFQKTGSRWQEHVIPIGLLIFLLTPSSLQAVAARIGYEMHLVSFIVGPALYSLTPGLVPGIDYFSQYSIGQPFLFSLILPSSADATILRYVSLMVVCMIVYYALLYYFLRWLFNSSLWSLWITVIALFLQFHTDRIFFDPSSYVLRHPLMIAVISLVAYWVRRDLEWKVGLIIAGLLSTSFFLNTETGVYQILAVVTVAAFAARSNARAVFLSVAVVIVTILLFMCFSFAAFGPRVFSMEFLKKVLEPLWMYSGGYGSVPVDWAYGWHVFYNVIAPGIALATIGWGVILLKRTHSAEDRSKTAALVMTASLGIMMTAKYWNMSLVALWHVNALPFLVIMGWWWRELFVVLRKSHKEPNRGGHEIQWMGAVALGMVALALVMYAGDVRNPSQYGLRAYLKYPSAWSAPVRNLNSACRNLSCSAPRLAKEDIALITSLTRPDERVAILDWHDWAYLIEARRAPLFEFLPSLAMFTHAQIDSSLSALNLLFVVPGKDGKYVIAPPELEEKLLPEIEKNFVSVGRGTRLVALKRVNKVGVQN